MTLQPLDPLIMVGRLVRQKFDAVMVGSFHLVANGFDRHVEMLDNRILPAGD